MQNYLYKFILPFLLSSSLIFYVRGVTNNPFFQPAIYCGFVAFFVFIYYFCVRLRFSYLFLWLFFLVIFIAVLFIAQVNFIDFRYGMLNEIGRVLYPVVMLSVSVFICNKNDGLDLMLLRRVFAWVVVFLVIDLLYRLYVNGGVIPKFSRYDLKFGGLIFVDSNFSGVISGALLLLLGKYDISSRVIRCLLLIVFLYSFSLAAYFAMAFALFLSVDFGRVVNIVKPFLLSVMIFVGFFYISEDGSFLTKVEIINNVLDLYASGFSSVFLYGIGFGNFKEIYEGAAHNLFGIFSEAGLIFAIVFLYLHYLLSRLKDNKSAVIFVLISGFVSLYPLAYLGAVYLFLIGKRKKIVV